MQVAYDVVSKETPFLAYMMTFNGHKPYSGELNGKMNSFYSKVNNMYRNVYSDPVKFYIAKNMYLEKGLEYLLEKLEEDNLLNDTVICLVPDHYPYGLLDADYEYLLELYKNEQVVKDVTYRDRTDIILWSGSLENEYKSLIKPVDKVTCTIDLMPTLLNLFGFEFDSRLYPGRDVFSNSEGVVIYQNGMYINNELKINTAPTTFRNKSSYQMYEISNLLNYCRFNVKNDYYGYLTGEKGKKQKTCY